LKCSEINRLLKKLKFEKNPAKKRSKETEVYDLFIDGLLVISGITVPNHPGDEIPKGTLHSIKKGICLKKRDDFYAALNCPMKFKDYKSHLKKKKFF
jgi:hypothetical protein